MKKTIGIISLVIELFAPSHVPGQGTLYVSNLGQSPTDSVNVGSDAWGAAFFRTGTNSGGYTLDSVQLMMSPQAGNPNGLVVSIYDYDRRFPGIRLGVLTGSDPAAGGIFSYSTSSITLSSSTPYFIVVTSATPASQGSYFWNTTTAVSFASGDSWSMGFGGSGLGYLRSADGINWMGSGSLAFSPQFAVYATAIPEPSIPVMMVLGLVGLSFLRCRR